MIYHIHVTCDRCSWLQSAMSCNDFTLLLAGLRSPFPCNPVYSAMKAIEHTLEENWYTSYTKLAGSLQDKHFNDHERELLALPACHGGLGLPIRARTAPGHFADCSRITAPLVQLVCEQSPDYIQEIDISSSIGSQVQSSQMQ